MKTWSKGVGAIASAVLAAVLAISQMSCLSPGDQAALAGFNTSLQNATMVIGKDKQTVLELQAELEKYRVEFMQVVADIKAQKVPAESGIALLGKIMTNINATQAKIVSVQKLVDENVAAAKSVQASIGDLQKKNIPWQYWLLPIGTAVAGVAGMFIPGISPLAQMLATANKSLNSTQEAAGSLSRTLDTVVAAADTKADSNEFTKLRSNLMHTEQKLDEVATKALYDELRTKAQAGLI